MVRLKCTGSCNWPLYFLLCDNIIDTYFLLKFPSTYLSPKLNTVLFLLKKNLKAILIILIILITNQI